MIFLPGGPPHQDMFDLKMDAPAEIRGEFQPIKTNVPGIEICEHFPQIASHDGQADPDPLDRRRQRRPRRLPVPHRASPQRPAAARRLAVAGLGAVEAARARRIRRCRRSSACRRRWDTWHGPTPASRAFFGVAHAPFKPDGEGKADMVLNGITLDRLGDRKALLTSFDRFRRDADASGMMDGLDTFNEQAFGVLTSSRLDGGPRHQQGRSRAFASATARATRKNRDDGGPQLMEHFLMARRLVEAGTRCVTLAFSRWDRHGGNFAACRQDMPMLDQGLSALIDDLHNRGLDKDVSVVVWGEFGRTPKINNDAGRDHWPNVSCALLAGGGMRTGQVIGSTDRLGAEAKDRPVHFQEVFATLYHRLGIDVNHVTLPDLSGRPQYLVDRGYQPMPEVI